MAVKKLQCSGASNIPYRIYIAYSKVWWETVVLKWVGMGVPVTITPNDWIEWM